MSLGRGLESLIPKKDSGAGAQQSPAANFSQQDPASYPAAPHILHSNEPVEPLVQPELENYIPNDNSVSLAINRASRHGGASEAVFQIDVNKISSNPHQPRRHFDEAALHELAASIREFGVIQPIVVTKIFKETDNGSDVEYQLVAGERRLLASKMAGFERIPAIIKSVMTHRENLEMAIIENLQRENLTPIENARAFARLQDEFGLTQREIASRLGKSREAVANAVRLLNLPSFVQDAIEHGKVSESQARLLLSVNDLATQESLFNDIVRNNLSVRDLRDRIEKSSPTKVRQPRPIALVSPELVEVKERLEAALGAPILIEQKGESGKIVISFYSPEELKGIISRLGADGEWEGN